VLRALETVSLNAQDYCKRAVNWLKAVQKSDGSFGESLRSYHVESSKGQGNAGGWPSSRGRPSGGGRSNASSSGK